MLAYNSVEVNRIVTILLPKQSLTEDLQYIMLNLIWNIYYLVKLKKINAILN